MNPHRVMLSPWQFKPDFDISLRQFFCFHETECIVSGMQFIINLKFHSSMWRATHMICRRYLGWQLYNVGGRRSTKRRKIEAIMSAFIAIQNYSNKLTSELKTMIKIKSRIMLNSLSALDESLRAKKTPKLCQHERMHDARLNNLMCCNRFGFCSRRVFYGINMRITTLQNQFIT